MPHLHERSLLEVGTCQQSSSPYIPIANMSVSLRAHKKSNEARPSSAERLKNSLALLRCYIKIGEILINCF